MLRSVSMIVSGDDSGAYPLNIQPGSDAKGIADLKKCVRFSYAFLSYRMKGPSNDREVTTHGGLPNHRAVLAEERGRHI